MKLRGNKRLADFCKIKGCFYYTRNGVETVHVACVKHGKVDIVPYLGFATGPVVWSCPHCIAEHLNKELVDCEARNPRYIGSCEACSETQNLEECKVCGNSFCPTHMIEGTCVKCAEGMPYCGCF